MCSQYATDGQKAEAKVDTQACSRTRRAKLSLGCEPREDALKRIRIMWRAAKNLKKEEAEEQVADGCGSQEWIMRILRCVPQAAADRESFLLQSSERQKERKLARQSTSSASLRAVISNDQTLAHATDDGMDAWSEVSEDSVWTSVAVASLVMQHAQGRAGSAKTNVTTEVAQGREQARRNEGDLKVSEERASLWSAAASSSPFNRRRADRVRFPLPSADGPYPGQIQSQFAPHPA
ncbi:uncharacterized protein FOMMEDRAFT_169702 [Fomitiporia mediterranea MF3/22]|uniref:uncharacterized protein n=1 Tax=Fomitiporia mediterranea (strain MF3/22) TaxID=694068 RepID=UPI0004407BB2|nr:uncharacterized protein FOMMEDRAFT_169702 [Fomitiporia mediterranea MF3/22]EJD01620.1 hypothetical protein FOMMEDRAFT_169702 [Fomitiporia mediterranea MF3/22]